MLLLVYSFLPKKLINWIGKSKIFYTIRSSLLRDKKGNARLAEKKITYKLSDSLSIEYILIGPPKTIVKAAKFGIENSITRKVYEYCKDKPKGVIIDVGANFGSLSLIWAKALDQHQIHSFEVHPNIFNTLNTSKVANHLNNLHIWNLAVSDSSEPLEFSLHSKSALLSNTSSNLSTFTVRGITLDSFFQDLSNDPILSIKIDTDGNDYAVLKGATNILEKYQPLIVIEVNGDSQIFDFLWKMNYNIYDMNNQLIKQNIDFDFSESKFSNVFAFCENSFFSKL
jgi:FkbM family methyltransferase